MFLALIFHLYRTIDGRRQSNFDFTLEPCPITNSKPVYKLSKTDTLSVKTDFTQHERCHL